MRAGDGSDELAFEDAMMRLRIGDLTGAAAVIRGRQAPASSPGALLKLASELRFEDPDLARGLLEKISFDELSRKQLPDALVLGNKLGLQAAADAIMPRLFGPGAEPSGIVLIDNVEEAIVFIREETERLRKVDADRTEKWLKAEIPTHLLFDGSPAELAWFYHRPFVEPPIIREGGNLEDKPFLVRSGAKRIVDLVPGTDLVVDVTALLVGQELGLLDHLEHVWDRISLPNETPELLRAMEQELEQQFGHIAIEAGEIRRRLEAGHFAPNPKDGKDLTLVISPDDRDDTSAVTLAELLDYLMTKGMEPDTVTAALGKLSIAAAVAPPTFPGFAELIISPADLAIVMRTGLLDRILQDVTLSVTHDAKGRWLDGFDRHLAGRARADKIKQLRQLVARKADAGIWNFLPVEPDDHKGLGNSGPAGHMFLSMIRAGKHTCEIWSEDRMMSLVGQIDRATIVDAQVVIDRLSSRVAEPIRRAALRRLRAAG